MAPKKEKAPPASRKRVGIWWMETWAIALKETQCNLATVFCLLPLYVGPRAFRVQYPIQDESGRINFAMFDKEVITEFCKSIGADLKRRQGLIRLAKNGERLGIFSLVVQSSDVNIFLI
ncbi:hypothetical protein Tco_0920606, partial [Tanacetum coccineum]